MKKGMKQMMAAALAGVLALGNGFTVLAEYEDNEYFDGNLEYNNRLKQDIERNEKELEETESLIGALEESLEELKAEYEELEAAYEAEMKKDGVKDMNLVVEYKEAKQKYNNAKSKSNSAQRAYEQQKKKKETLENLLQNETNKALTWTTKEEEGESENITYSFVLENKNGNWVLWAQYRSWNELMGGQWEYNPVIKDDLNIDLYDGNDCLESGLSRMEEYDTESHLYWDAPDSLTAGKTYYIELNGSRFAIRANDYQEKNSGISNTGSEVFQGCSWEKDEKGWWVQRPDGSYLTNQWYQSPASGRWYYMGADGYMLTNTKTPDEYYVNEDGAWVPEGN